MSEGAGSGRALLDAVEARVLGCLVEKQRTTPDDYPLTLNSLTRACNQSTSRDPVMACSAGEVERAVTSLKARGVLRFVYSQSNRATKYRHVLDEAWGLDDATAALLSLLLLRGPQTPGELRTRSGRLHPFASPEEVTEVLRSMAARSPALAEELERVPGQKERRWAELVSERDAAAAPAPAVPPGSPAGAEPAPAVATAAPVGGGAPVGDATPAGGGGPAAAGGAGDLAGRVAALEQEVRRLRAALEALAGPLED